MKSGLFIRLMLFLLLMSCEESNDLTQLKADQITYGNCKTVTKNSENTERIEYKTVDRNYLQIKHINVWFNCEPGQLLVDVNRLNDTIFVDENEEKPMANCICPYDLCYRIGPMGYG